MDIKGDKKGRVYWNHNCLSVSLSSINVKKYSLYSNEHPLTSGKRCVIYISIDNEKSAEFAFYIYSDLVVVKKENDSKGYYSVDLGVFAYTLINDTLHFSVPKGILGNFVPFKAWSAVIKTRSKKETLR
jgi:hypothetical protein